VSSLIIACNTLPDWTGLDGSESDKTDMGNLPSTFFKVGRRAGQLDSGIKTSFLLWSHNSSQTRRHAESVCSRVDWMNLEALQWKSTCKLHSTTCDMQTFISLKKASSNTDV